MDPDTEEMIDTEKQERGREPDWLAEQVELLTLEEGSRRRAHLRGRYCVGPSRCDPRSGSSRFEAQHGPFGERRH